LKHTLAVAVVTLHALGALATAQTPPSGAPAAPTGDARRGKQLYEKTLRCYACHGFDGQTGTPRLVPMTRQERAFIAYLRAPATPAMPSFAAAPERDLTDIYAYIRSIPAAASPIENIPLLKSIVERRSKAK
jgi:mono/diheme cytochrome c family protein